MTCAENFEGRFVYRLSGIRAVELPTRATGRQGIWTSRVQGADADGAAIAAGLRGGIGYAPSNDYAWRIQCAGCVLVLGWSAIAGMERSQYAKRDSMTRFVLICWLAALMALVACDQAAPTENPASDISVEGSPTATPEPSPTLTSLPEATPTPTENPVSPPSPALEPSSEISSVLQTAEWRGLTVAAEYRCSPL